jgi:hypothetical protein
MLKEGKNELSLGYRCTYSYEPGIYNGESYEYVQRNLRGNHLALVDEARCNVAVLDSKTKIVFDNFDINLKENTMADTEAEKKAKDAAEAEKAVKDAAEKAEADKKAKDAAEEEAKKKEEEEGKDAEEKEKEKVVKDALDKWDADKKAKDAKAKDEMNRVKPDGTKADDKAMDEALKSITKLTADMAVLKSGGVTKGILQHIAQRDALAEKLSTFIGTFDHSEKTLEDVAKYGCEKLGLKTPAGSETIALDAYFHNRNSKPEPIFGFDSSRSSSGSKLKDVIKKAV